jgi:VanZ family protein
VTKSTAWPLALLYAALLVYASLYPFADWRDQGIAPWSFVTAPWPKYWTSFDVISNLLGYAPMGFLLALGILRSPKLGLARGRWAAIFAILLASLAAGLLSFLMETLQSYLPLRVPSNLDLALNFGGAMLGAALAALLQQIGVIDRWSRFRGRWFVQDSRGALALLWVWPVALLFPASVPLGLGQVLERLEPGLAELLAGTPFLQWLPLREIELQPLLPATELLCVMLGALIPCLLGFGVIRSRWRRVAFVLLVALAGVGMTALSAALTYGTGHAWAWLGLPVRYGLLAAGALALVLVWLPQRVCTALLVVALLLLNQAPEGAYFAQTLQTWEQGRFARFHGLAQWLGWFWPYAVLVYVLVRLPRQPPSAPSAAALPAPLN